MNPRPGWNRRAIALARSRQHHIKNKSVVCCTPELCGVFPHLLMFGSFSTL